MKKIAEIIAVMSVLALATACGGGGSSSNPSTPVPPPAMTDTTAPSVMFDPATGSVPSGQTFAATLTATDDVGVTSGPDVSCSNGGSFANNLFTAPDVMTETTSVCTATASDAAGNEGSATLTMTVNPPPDTTAPTVMFDPASGSALTGQTFAATLTATDDVGVTSGPDVNCSNGGSFANNLFTAPDVTTETTSVCTATAGDAAGNEGSATLTMTVNPDTTDPVVMFDPASGSVLTGQTFAATLTATDDVGVTSGPDVSCSNGGSFANNLFTAPDVTTETTSVCTATAGDAAGNEGSATLTMTVTLPASVIISGQLTFDFVPHNTASNGLDYSAITQNPMRGVVVQALDASGAVLDSDISDASGNYALDVSPVIDVRIRANAQLLSSSGATWDVMVTDNTNNNDLYVFDGNLADSGTTDSTRNLNAGSGWDGSAYTSERAAGPFAILDPVYETIQKFAAVDPDIVLPPLQFLWSVNNRAVDGNRAVGEITTSSYVPLASGDCGNIYLLGDADADTDEYDPGVVVREWGYYFADCLSRSDTRDVPRGPGERLDPRLALGEGWGYAVAAIGTGDPVVRNSFGPGQSQGTVVDVEANTNVPAGWYNAASVSSILYDVYDSTDDGADVLSLGLGPIYRVFVDPGYTGTPLLTTIFTFLDRLKAEAPGSVAAIDALAAGQDINGTGADGAGETNDGGIASALPVYHTAVIDGAAVEVCSVDDAGTVNKLGNTVFIRFSVPTEGPYTIAMSGPRGNPAFVIFRAGTGIAFASGAVDPGAVDPGSATWTEVFPVGEYVIEALDFDNVLPLSAVRSGDFCYDITIAPPDTTPPVVMFDPASGSVLSTQTLASTLTATDDVGVTSGPDVSCSNGGFFANNLFTAPDVMTETTSVCTATARDAAGNEGSATTSVCTATARDAAGNEGSATLTVTVTLPDPTAPIVRFRPASGTVPSGQTFAATLTATDDVGVTSGPDVSCSNGGSFAGDLFTAPVVTTLTTSVCTATARDADGNEGSATLTMTVTPPDITDPVVMFNPATGSVLGGQIFAATLTATDNVGVTSGPDVSCSNGGSFAGDLFTAPVVTAETVSVCTATARDAAGNEGSATLTMTVNPDTTAPVVMFTPATGSVLDGGTFAAILTATDDVGVTSGPTVSCSNGGSFANNLFTAPVVTTETTSVCTATASDATGNEGSATLTMTIAVGVIISGRLTFDFVPHDTTTGGLDYTATTRKPMRGVVVEALDASGSSLGFGISDASGNYAINVNPGTDVRIRARAQLLSTSGATWDVRVTDNTNNNGLYAFEGSLADSGTVASTRDLHLSSGWDGSAYTGARAGGIAAILDPVYDTMQQFAAVDPDIAFPPLEFRWSENNRAVQGDLSLGEITTSFYLTAGCPGFIYLLGDDNADTDEYDLGVVVHEWGHYFEDCFSRTDTIGGSHSRLDRLDPRLALGEGWGYAMAAIGIGNPVFYDSFGSGQGMGTERNVEENTNSPAGWYNEASVQSILYDLYDSADDGADVLSLGLGPIYRTLVDPGYTGTPLFTTIFTFLDRLKAVAPGNTADIEALAAGQGIDGTGADGAGETNDGGIASALPVYRTAVLDGAAVEVCSVDDAGSFNKLGNRAWVRFSVPAEGIYTITMSGPRGNPAFGIFSAGILIAPANSGMPNSETWTGFLPVGEYVIEALDLNNVSGVAAAQPEDYCYDITLTTTG